MQDTKPVFESDTNPVFESDTNSDARRRPQQPIATLSSQPFDYRWALGLVYRRSPPSRSFRGVLGSLRRKQPEQIGHRRLLLRLFRVGTSSRARPGASTFHVLIVGESHHPRKQLSC